MLKKIYNFFLENIHDADFLLQQKARVLLTIIITYCLVFFIYTIFFLTIKTRDLGILLPFSLGFMVLFSLLVLLRRGHFSLFAHSSLIISLAMLWFVHFFESGPFIQRMDSIVLILAALMMTPLIFYKREKGILLYFGINLLLLVFSAIYFGNHYGKSAAVMREFLMDNVTAFFFAGFFCFQIFNIYKRAIYHVLAKEEEIHAQYEELAASSEELEAMNDELISTHQDLLDSNENIKREKEMISTTLASIGDGVITMDVNGFILGINKAALDILELKGEQKNKNISSLVKLQPYKDDSTINDIVSMVLEEGKPVELEQNTIFVTEMGNMKYISSIITPLKDSSERINGAVMAFRDVTERHKMEEELLKASKIESLGLFAGGIAHDFNNLLTAILGNISITRLNLGADNANTEFLNDAEKASLRAKDLTNQLLTFSRGGAPIRVTSSLRNIIIDAASFVLSGSSVGSEFDLPDDLWNAEVDRGQIGQVIQNLVLNARQSMHEGGIVCISANNLFIENEASEQNLKPGRYIRVSVRDSGTGIPGEILNRIFDPFFSTKKEGNGLGLAVTASIIRKHNGEISVETGPDKGTTFEFYLPATLEEPQEIKVAGKHGSFKNLRVLLMDDDEIVLRVGKNMLERLGCEVLLASDGAEAIGMYCREKQLPDPIDVIIMDLTVPGGMGGKKAIMELQKLDDSVCAVVSSGYSNDRVMANYRDYGFKSYIVKPYSIEEIEGAIAEALEKKEDK